MRLKKTASAVICVILSAFLLGGCGGEVAAVPITGEPVAAPTVVTEKNEAPEPVAAKKVLPSRFSDFKPYETEAPGLAVEGNDRARIDWSNADCGYITVEYTEKTDKSIKMQVCGEELKYTYCIRPGKEAVFPLAEGSGEYTVTLYENITGNKYAAVISACFRAEIEDENGIFLYPNCYVGFLPDSAVVEMARFLIKGCGDEIDVVKAIYGFVIENFTYDKEMANTVTSSYLPDPDAFLVKKAGICLDYASCMTAMLRSVGIPCKLVTGYTGEAYHAWINVYTEEDGWIDGVIRFNGKDWTLMDPTFASTGKNAKKIQEYIGDGENYTAKYYY